MLPIKKIELIVQNFDRESDAAHDLGHLRRVASGAQWFVRMSDGNNEEQQMAYVAGLLHDICRPKSGNADGHEIASAELSRKLLLKLNVDSETIEQVTDAISSHRAPAKWNSPAHESVFFADKVFELMGAMILFRRTVWVGEHREFHNETVTDSIIDRFESSNRKHRPSHFNKSFRKLVNEQYSWPVRFLRALQDEEAWALYLGAAGFSNGAHEKKPINVFMRSFKPIEREDAKAKTEALKYFNGRKWNDWAAMVRH